MPSPSRLVPRLLSSLALIVSLAHSAFARGEGADACAAPRTPVFLGALADRTDGRWGLMADRRPSEVVAAALAEVLGDSRRVVRAAERAAAPARIPVPDAALLAAARREHAEVAVTGTVEAFGNDDVRQPGRFARWGIGADEASTTAEVTVSLRVLDVRDGTVLIESRATRSRRTRGYASASRTEAAPILNEALAQALDEVVRDLDRVLTERLDARWESTVMLEGADRMWLDAGAARGVFVGQRLEIWRSGTTVIDEDHIRIGDEDRRVGAVVVESLLGQGRARLRLVEGAAHSGDLVRPCRRGDDVTAMR